MYAAQLLVAFAVWLLQVVPTELLDTLDTLLKLTALAFLVIPVTEVRRVLGGLPDIPLPGKNEDGKKNVIAAGRWFSWLAAGGVALFGHSIGWLAPPDFANFQAWYALELSILAGMANIIYDRFWKGQVGLQAEYVIEGPVVEVPSIEGYVI
jgi:hypothetical protein